MLTETRLGRVQCNTIIRDLDKAIYEFYRQYGRWPSHIRMQARAWDWLMARLKHDFYGWAWEFSNCRDAKLTYKGIEVYLGRTEADDIVYIEYEY